MSYQITVTLLPLKLAMLQAAGGDQSHVAQQFIQQEKEVVQATFTKAARFAGCGKVVAEKLNYHAVKITYLNFFLL